MGFLVRILVIGVVILIGYGLILEYFSNEDVRPAYHVIFGIIALIFLVNMCTGGCS